MGLSSKLRALIEYANETTGAGDTTIGECVRTLVEGYNGGANVPSQSLILPQGRLSSQIASLIAYANETTGVGDTRLGEAIKTLCDGYRKEDLVLYDYLRTDGVAYIDTGIYIDNSQRLEIMFGEIVSKTSYHLFGASSNEATKRIQWAKSSSTAYVSFLSTERSKGNDYIKSNDKVEIYIDRSKGSSWTLCFDRNGSTAISYTSTPWDFRVSERSFLLFCTKANNGTSINTNRTICEIKRFTLKNIEGEIIADFVPCTYNDIAGMWDLIGEKFYGNSNSTGTFSVRND